MSHLLYKGITNSFDIETLQIVTLSHGPNDNIKTAILSPIRECHRTGHVPVTYPSRQKSVIYTLQFNSAVFNQFEAH